MSNFIQSNGIMSEGYGFAPKAVMRDSRLTIEAKAIYAYMSSFAGAGLSSFPSIELQLAELGISKTRYYKHRKLLEQFGYITIKQTRIKNQNNKSVNDKNIYTLEQFPIDKTVTSEVTQNEESEKHIENTSFSEVTQNEYTQNVVAHHKDSNSNNLNSNNLNSNNLSSSSNEDDEEVKKIMKICQLQNFKLKKEDVKSLLLVYDFTKISKAIITASSINNEIKNYKGYLVSVLNDMEKVKITNIKIDKDNKPKSNNFTERKYDEDFYENLEKNLNTNNALEDDKYNPINEYFKQNRQA